MFLYLSCLIGILALTSWIFLLVWENKDYYRKLKLKEKSDKAKKEAMKRKNKELKWPENLSHVDFLEKEK